MPKLETLQTFAPASRSFSTQEILPCIAANISGDWNQYKSINQNYKIKHFEEEKDITITLIPASVDSTHPDSQIEPKALTKSATHPKPIKKKCT
jgi:hypothetical protein